MDEQVPENGSEEQYLSKHSYFPLLVVNSWPQLKKVYRINSCSRFNSELKLFKRLTDDLL